jgi:hypothetical protein
VRAAAGYVRGSKSAEVTVMSILKKLLHELEHEDGHAYAWGGGSLVVIVLVVLLLILIF